MPPLADPINPPVCSATWCSNQAIGSYEEMKEVPAWRRPPLKAWQMVLEVGALSHYCAQHEKVAKATSLALLPR